MTALALAPPDIGDDDPPDDDRFTPVYHPSPYGIPKGPNVVALLVEVMRAARAVPKDGHNASQNFNFRGIDGVLNSVGPALRTVGVVPIPTLVTMKRSTVLVGRNQSPMDSVYLEIDYRFYGPALDSISCLVPGTSMDSGDKAVSKAMSVAYRTALIQVFALPTMETDPDAHSYERSPEAAEDDALLVQAMEFRDAALAAPDTASIEKLIELAKAVPGLGGVEVPDAEGHPVPLATVIIDRRSQLWHMQPAEKPAASATLPPEMNPAVRLASDGQLQRIGILLGEAGVKSRDVRLVAVSAMVDRQLTSSAELTLAEASAVIKRLEANVAEGGADAMIAELVENAAAKAGT